MIDANQGKSRRPGDAFRCLNADEQRSDEPRSMRHRKTVEILDSQVDQLPAGPMVRFSLRATSNNPEAPPPPPPAGRGAPPVR